MAVDTIEESGNDTPHAHQKKKTNLHIILPLDFQISATRKFAQMMHEKPHLDHD